MQDNKDKHSDKTNRRAFITSGAVGGTLGMLASAADAGMPTPKETAGPFYPVMVQKDKDFDLTIIEGHKKSAKGQAIMIQGQVLDTNGKPIEDATVDLWQANAAGKYRHPHDPNPVPIDENFQGWAIVPSGKEGKFQFKTIIPGAYPASKTWMRPPHIHFKVSKRGFVEIVTQMYFPGHKLNEPDRLLNRKTAAEQKMMIAKKTPGDIDVYAYNIVLEKA
ncbi:MAG: protocatechuate 3,4-dioxygenase [Blastopirellula sp.]|nr:MAG: protocatechuate 3,4-dioxygenase [Blastopirellula sp.]